MKVKLIELPQFDVASLPSPAMPAGKGDKAAVEVVLPKSKQIVVVWCQGCGRFHGFLSEFLRGDVDRPSTTGPIEISTKTLPQLIRADDASRCIFTITDGVMRWDESSTHPMAGKEHMLADEENMQQMEGPKL